MKTSIIKSIISQLERLFKIGVLTLPVWVLLLAFSAKAGDIKWQGGTASYTNAPDWVGGVVPGLLDNAINDNTTNNVVQINVGDPDWTVNQIRAGNSSGSGAFLQNGQTVNLTGTNFNGSVGSTFITSVRLGVAAGDTGVYTLNGGSINYSNGLFNVGELGTGILNIYGGTITGSGFFYANIGAIATPTAITATVGGGLTEGDFTWFEQGVYVPDGTVGLPHPGVTITSVSQPDHSFIMPPSYTVNDAVMISAAVTNATITPTVPAACSGLSFLGSAGNGPVVVNYAVHHADGTTETGSLSVVDWFGSGTNVLGVGGRVDALGINFQTFGAGNNPHLLSLDIVVTDTGSAVTNIGLTYVSGGVACILGVSSSTGGAFAPVTMTGYNEDMIVEVGAPIVSGSVTDIVNQTNGAIVIASPGQFLIGNVGTAIYNLSGGSIDVSNYVAIGRSSGNGTFNMTGGTLNQDGGGGNLLVGTGFNNNGPSAVGVLNQSAGTINSQGQFLVPESSPSTGTYNLSGTGTLNVNNWLAVGRNSGSGVLNLTNGTITKTGTTGNHFDVGASGPGVLNQYGGVITNTTSDFWLGESGAGTWNMNGGAAYLGTMVMCVNGSATATLNLNGGLINLNGISSNSIGVTTLDFNGGTLQAAADNVNFLSGMTLALMDAGGAVIDSQGYGITIGQELDDLSGGGLAKNGSGTLTLSGANTYTGPTVVNAGTLVVDTSSGANGNYTVADSAGLSVVVKSANAQRNMANLTLAGSTAASLGVDLGAFGTPVSAPLNVSGTLAVNGTITVNLADVDRIAVGAVAIALLGHHHDAPLAVEVSGRLANPTKYAKVTSARPRSRRR